MKKKCILFIHGLGSNEEETWGDLDKILKVKKNSIEFSKFNNIDFKYFNYESKKNTNLSSLTQKIIVNFLNSDDQKANLSFQIDNISQTLRTELNKEEFSQYENISIIAHSMGGVISANYILNELDQKRTPCVDRILYICTPFIGSVFADMAKKMGFNSQETGELATSSILLDTLVSRVEELERSTNSTYVFGDRDDVIKDCKKLFDYDSTWVFKGDHSSILSGSNLDSNYDYLEKFIINEGCPTFIETLYRRAKDNGELIFSNKFVRKIDSSKNKMYLNHLDNYLLKDNNGLDILIQEEMMNLISNHHFTPHNQHCWAKSYYVENESNEANLELFWKKIISNEYLDPYFYIGPRGSGKTLTQNEWLRKYFPEMESNNIVYVRCDVHKIYDAMGNSRKNNGYSNLSIDDYLDMQFLYVFLKYRSKEFNFKGTDKQGVESVALKNMYSALNKLDTKAVQNSTFENLGEFLDIQSRNIIHNEEKIRSSNRNDKFSNRDYRFSNRNYSYAIELMGNITSTDEIPMLLHEVNSCTIEQIINNKFPPVFEIYLGVLDEARRNEFKREIIKTIKENITDDENILKSDLETTLLKINKKINSSRKNTTETWLKVSRYIQNFAVANNYKILRIIDGIDNIIVQDSTNDKIFFKGKIEELSELKNKPNNKNIFYFISLRSDSFLELQDSFKKYELNSVSNRDTCFYKYFHDYASNSIKEILTKRFEALESIFSFSNSNKESLFLKILHYIFIKYEHPSLREECSFQNIRAILRHHIFLSLHCVFEFKRKKLCVFNESKCKSILDKNFEVIYFLRNKVYIYTEETTGDAGDYKYKVFPNLFYTHHRHDKWTGLCRLRIIQLLTNNRLSKKEIIEKLSCLYPREYIEKKIENLLNYNLIESELNDDLGELKLGYIATHKAGYLLSIIKNNLNSIYFLCLDTPLPEKYVNEDDTFSSSSYLSVYIRKRDVSENTGYGNSIVKSVTTFLLFVTYIHELELMSLRKNNLNHQELKKFSNPLEIVSIEKEMINIFKRTISNPESIKKYFMQVGKYSKHKLESDLLKFGWIE